MMHYQREYNTARAVFSLLELGGWAVIIIGILAAAAGFSTGGMMSAFTRSPSLIARLISTLPGISMGVVGLFIVAYVQAARAQVDSAEMTAEMLTLAKKSAGPAGS